MTHFQRDVCHYSDADTKNICFPLNVCHYSFANTENMLLSLRSRIECDVSLKVKWPNVRGPNGRVGLLLILETAAL